MKKALFYVVLIVSIFMIIVGIYSLETNKTLIPFLNVNRITIFFIIVFFQCLYLYSKKQPAPRVYANISKEEDRVYNKESVNSSVRLKDVAGLEEVKEEIMELIDFINNADVYKKLGAKIPKGILFYGPPGTGKTLLASAIAGETKVAFFAASGSEFVEKYAGVGAKRIRDLFAKVKKDAPAILFIDEIDAIGCKRNDDGQQESNQTLNQLLTEMDGFKGENEEEKIVLIIGATNRLDILDEALLRPGRLDKHIYVGNPNKIAREEILKVHTRNKPLDGDVDISSIALKTHGLSGAHLSSIANEAAILAVRGKRDRILQEDFDAAIERIIAGLKLKKSTVSDKEKRIVAYHEAGHAIIGKILGVGEIAKVSIIPTGQALGYVLNASNEDKYLYTKNDLYNKIQALLGGRAAEEIVFQEVTTGAKDDLQKATDMILGMICEYGMSDLGHRTFHHSFQRENMKQINKEANKIIGECYEKAINILTRNQEALIRIANHLLEKESITGGELEDYIRESGKLVN